MTDQQPTLRFDHREIAVIFSLFVFVSLLMFTVGILVGKGLAQAKYEGLLFHEAERARQLSTTPASGADHSPTGSSINSGSVDIHGSHASTHDSLAAATTPAAGAESGHDPIETEKPVAEEKKVEPLELIPAKPSIAESHTGSFKEPTGKNESTEGVLKNPKIRSLLEDAEPSSKRATASIPKRSPEKAVPKSAAQGKFTVQVGSYPTEKDATERVETLKKLGFPYAYFSAKELGENKETWYRVWLGYYPDSESAQGAGKLLQERGEVKNYLVRKTDTVM